MIPTTLFVFTLGFVCHSLMGPIVGFIVGLTLVYFCTVAGSTLAFLFARCLLKDTILSAIKPTWIKTRAVLKAIEHKGFKIVFLLRLAPIVPFSLLNYALGVSNVPLLDYTLGSIGLLPKQALYMYIAISVGSLSDAIKKQEDSTTQLIVLLSLGTVIGIICTVYVTLVAKREMNKILDENQSPILGEAEESLNN